jgi:hypothetical protein
LDADLGRAPLGDERFERDARDGLVDQLAQRNSSAAAALRPRDDQERAVEAALEVAPARIRLQRNVPGGLAVADQRLARDGRVILPRARERERPLHLEIAERVNVESYAEVAVHSPICAL